MAVFYIVHCVSDCAAAAGGAQHCWHISVACVRYIGACPEVTRSAPHAFVYVCHQCGIINACVLSSFALFGPRLAYHGRA